jgi:hypothetical protein
VAFVCAGGQLVSIHQHLVLRGLKFFNGHHHAPPHSRLHPKP